MELQIWTSHFKIDLMDKYKISITELGSFGSLWQFTALKTWKSIKLLGEKHRGPGGNIDTAHQFQKQIYTTKQNKKNFEDRDKE